MITVIWVVNGYFLEVKRILKSTRKSVFSCQFQNPRAEWVEIENTKFFLTDFEVFEYLIAFQVKEKK